MRTDDEIGGYLTIESNENNDIFRSEDIFVNTGRNALELILENITNITTLYISKFTCDVIMEPINKLNLHIKFYSIDKNLEIAEELKLRDEEYLLYTNYFGVKDKYIATLNNIYRGNLIIDNAQALMSKIKTTGPQFFSPRKFIGLADGGIVRGIKDFDKSKYNTDVSYKRYTHLLKRIDFDAQSAYKDFLYNESTLIGQGIKNMSKLTFTMIKNTDINYIRDVRHSNFNYLHKNLKMSNKLNIDNFGDFECPMIYPYYSHDENLRQRLITNKIYVATYWPNVFQWSREDSIEYKLATNLIPIPIDQRYGIKEMQTIIKTINNNEQ